jgi:hypothetical protein
MVKKARPGAAATASPAVRSSTPPQGRSGGRHLLQKVAAARKRPGRYVAWSDDRSNKHPKAIKIVQHKSGAAVWHPLLD